MGLMLDILRNSRCLAFVDQAGSGALAQIENRQPDGFHYLTEEARECLLNNYRERLYLIYSQVLTEEVRKKLEKIDPVGLMLGRFKPESLQIAAGNLIEQADGNIAAYLHRKYPLLNAYKKQIHDNFIDCFSDFLQAFLHKKDEVSEKLLNGKTIHRIRHLSTDGADIHRNGRCVIGVTTDAGTVYYKPHDCSLDILFHEITEKWFSDCTVAANVVDGVCFAFVSCLKHEPVSREDDVAAYYYHFGILAALFHGLGTTDMHMENIISCADKPAAMDIETLLGTAMRASESADKMGRLHGQQISESLVRTCLLPLRLYKGPIVSPMYSSRENAVCLPEYEGQLKTVEGYETEFARGFREGYDRMLRHRDELLEMIDGYQHATVRCLLRNTSFYNLIRQMLFQPGYLADADSREKVYAKLCSPYTVYAIEPEQEILKYEWRCLLKGDIPYYCTTAAGKDLCGETPGQIVVKAYFQTSVMDSARHFLSRLSRGEEAFEQDLLRVVFAHVPTDEKPETESEPIPGGTVCEEKLREETVELFRNLTQDEIRCTDGSPLWISMAESLEMTDSFGNLAMICNAGKLAAHIAESDCPPEIRKEAAAFSETICLQVTQILDELEQAEIKEIDLYKVLPAGLYTGLGCVILALREMVLAGVAGASGLVDRIVRYGLENKLYRYKKTNAAEGISGLMLALFALEQTEDVNALFFAAAERLLEEDLPNRADLPYGCAGIGAALSAAYEISGDERFRQGALKAFQKVRDDYKPELSGWPDGNAKVKWMADKGPHAAGIYLAAAFAKDKLSEDPEGTEPLTDSICSAALTSILEEKTILRLDSLNQGNALTVLALLHAGKKERAGQVLSAMLNRKDKKGCFTVTPDGIRSTFDPSYYFGATGISYAFMMFYERILSFRLVR